MRKLAHLPWFPLSLEVGIGLAARELCTVCGGSALAVQELVVLAVLMVVNHVEIPACGQLNSGAVEAGCEIVADRSGTWVVLVSIRQIRNSCLMAVATADARWGGVVLWLWGPLDMPLVVFIKAPACSRSRNSDQVLQRLLSVGVTLSPNGKLHEPWDSAPTRSGRPGVLLLSNFFHPFQRFQAFISLLSNGLSSKCEITPISDACSCYSTFLSSVPKEFRGGASATQTRQHTLGSELTSVLSFLLSVAKTICVTPTGRPGGRDVSVPRPVGAQ